MSSNHPEQVSMAGGKAASSRGPAFHLIPTEGLIALADRFELGVERKGDKAWNALSNNQEVLLDKEFLIERCAHIIHHAMKIRDLLTGTALPTKGETVTDNAAAIAWAGMFFACAGNALELKDSRDFVKHVLDKEIHNACNENEILSYIDRNGKQVHDSTRPLERRSLLNGEEYTCLNGKLTGPMVFFKVAQGNGLPVYYSKNMSNVDWFSDGTPRRVNQSMSESELTGYTIPYERLSVCTP